MPMSRVYVGNLDSRVSERDLEDEFRVFGVIRRSVYLVMFYLFHTIFLFLREDFVFLLFRNRSFGFSSALHVFSMNLLS